MEPLRLALDVGALHGHRTGVGAAVGGLAGGLDARDDVDVAPYVVSFRAEHRRLQRRLPVPAAIAHRWWAHSSWPPVDRWLRRPDVIHGPNYVVPPARTARVVSVYDCWFLAHPELAAPAVRRAGAVLRRSVASGAVVHASSRATAAAAAELLATDRVEVVALGPVPAPDAAQRPVTAVGGVPFVLCIGTTERRKNVPALVDAFAAAADAVDGVDGADATGGRLHLVVAGAPGDDQPAVDAAIERLPSALRRRVVVTGAVDDGEKAWLLANAAVLAFPSLDEGFGFPVLEAQSAGVPVVATAVGSIPEVAGEGALLVASGDPDALAAGLARAVSDDAVRARLVAAGTRNVDRFSWAATAEAMVGVYRRAIEEHGRRR